MFIMKKFLWSISVWLGGNNGWTVLKDVLNFWNKITINYQCKSLMFYIKIILCLTFENRFTTREAFVYDSVGEDTERGGG